MSAAAERLRQEAETFDLQKVHADRWFRLRLVIAYAGLALLAVIAAFCIWIIATMDRHSTTVVVWATGGLGTEILGLVGTVVRMALNPTAIPKLGPVTTPLAASPRPKRVGK